MTTQRTNHAHTGDGDRSQHPFRDCFENTGGFTRKPARSDDAEGSGWDTDWASRNSMSLEDLAPAGSDRDESTEDGDTDSSEPAIGSELSAFGQLH